ncbi:MAG: sugar kinase [Berkelbacteria bacterium GW2011_GWE1_39_12]|uniref:Sugar kinase n=1 Tax=Berkelbacteria bacterium GW2011_GWE1_39_12 TaxID=1618337 RepID=A0A0G4B4B9_9BACT|nr:MAG: sugar kinase [Berkelbacteria bacterium GW2011_GWE1_39_12]
MRLKKRLAVLGHACLDITPRIIGQVPRHGKLSIVEPPIWSAGGVVSNTGLAAAKIGIGTTLVCKIGQDLFGDQLRGLYAYKPNVECCIIDSMDPTSFSIVLVPAKGDRSFLHCPGCNDTFTADDVPYALLTGIDHVHFGYLPIMKALYSDDGRDAVIMLSRLKSMGKTISMDMVQVDPRSETAKQDWEKILRKVLPFVDIFTPSFGEMVSIMPCFARYDTGHHGWGMMANKFLEWGCGAVMLKLGTKGLYLRTAKDSVIGDSDDWLEREIISIPFKEETFGSANGSGDVSIAGFLTAMLQGLSPELCLQFANGASSCSVEALDPLSAVRSWDEIWARIGNGWPLLSDATPGYSNRSELAGVFHGSEDPKCGPLKD